MYIAEIDTEGIKLTSNIKLIEIDNSNETKVNTIYSAGDSLILSVKYTEDNNLFVQKDDGIVLIDEEYRIRGKHCRLCCSTSEGN